MSNLNKILNDALMENLDQLDEGKFDIIKAPPREVSLGKAAGKFKEYGGKAVNDIKNLSTPEKIASTALTGAVGGTAYKVLKDGTDEESDKSKRELELAAQSSQIKNPEGLSFKDNVLYNLDKVGKHISDNKVPYGVGAAALAAGLGALALAKKLRAKKEAAKSKK